MVLPTLGRLKYLNLQLITSNSHDIVPVMWFNDFINTLGGDDAIDAGDWVMMFWVPEPNSTVAKSPSGSTSRSFATAPHRLSSSWARERNASEAKR